MHGPDETKFTDLIFSKVEEVLDLKNILAKLELWMKREEHLSNLKECIRT
jgi:malate synthase